MDTLLGLLGLLAFMACIIALAAAMTWLVVKISPTREGKSPAKKDSAA